MTKSTLEQSADSDRTPKFTGIDQNPSMKTLVFIPAWNEEDSIAAEFAHGVLTIRVPKAQRPQPRKIQIGTSGQSQPQEQQRLGSAEPPMQGQREEQRAAAERPQERGRSAPVEGAARERSSRREPSGSAA